MSRAALILFITGLFLSLLASVYGLGSSYRMLINLRSERAEFTRIAADGWIEDGAEIPLASLAKRGNRAKLAVDPWRPAGLAPAHIRILVCGKSVAEFQAVSHDEIAVSLNGECEPRRLSFEVINPFVSSQADSRKLGAKLKRFEITSRLGIPIVEPGLTLGTSLLILLLCLACVWRMSLRFGIVVGAIVCTISTLVIRGEQFGVFGNLFALWLFTFGLSLGISLLARDELTTFAVQGVTGDRVFLAAAVLLTFAGAALRFYGIDFGLPEHFHPDEVPKVNALLEMRSHGDLNPRYFLHPSLLLYSTYFMNEMLRFFGANGAWGESAFLAGRYVSALAGTASILVLFLLARRLFTPGISLLAAALLAVSPLHVTVSRYLKEDALLTFFVLLTMLFLIKAVQDGRRMSLVLSAVAAGMGASTKYSGILLLLPLLLAPWLRSGSLRPDKALLRTAICCLPLAALTFFICTPYSVFDSATFLKDLAYEKHHLTGGHTVGIDPWSQLWMFHVARSIIPGIGTLPFFAASIGIGICFWLRRMDALLLAGTLLLFYLPAEWAQSKPEPQPERYIVPCLPFLALLAAQGVQKLAPSISFVALASLLLIGYPLLRTINYAQEINDDTRLRLSRWMSENIPANSKIAVDFPNYGPALSASSYDVSYVEPAKFLESISIERLRSSPYDYLVLSSLYYERYFLQPSAPAAARERVREVFRRVPIVRQELPYFGSYGFHNPKLTLFSLKESDFALLDKELARKSRAEIEEASNIIHIMRE